MALIDQLNPPSIKRRKQDNGFTCFIPQGGVSVDDYPIFPFVPKPNGEKDVIDALLAEFGKILGHFKLNDHTQFL